MLAALLSGLTRPFLIAAGIAAAALALWLWLETHDAHVRADERSRWQAAADKAIADARSADQMRINAAWEAEQRAAGMRADFERQLRARNSAVQKTAACVTSPAVAAWADGMRTAGGGAGASPSNPRRAADVSAAASRGDIRR